MLYRLRSLADSVPLPEPCNRSDQTVRQQLRKQILSLTCLPLTHGTSDDEHAHLRWHMVVASAARCQRANERGSTSCLKRGSCSAAGEAGCWHGGNGKTQHLSRLFTCRKVLFIQTGSESTPRTLASSARDTSDCRTPSLTASRVPPAVV